ncbi:hypothetical protein TSUD_151190 [Trifolium subterraneum]|uniref:Uncharacterized protein n=1 Tax=Trifolium subterraneum TaxID=3900 RepID=A0A2Z6NVT8_TRISU|nr:hypothetical protein TSUD_151190 [Trifolium subterraneum]
MISEKRSTRELGLTTCITSMMVSGRWSDLIEDVATCKSCNTNLGMQSCFLELDPDFRDHK